MKDLFIEAIKSIREVLKAFYSEVLTKLYTLKNRKIVK